MTRRETSSTRRHRRTSSGSRSRMPRTRWSCLLISLPQHDRRDVVSCVGCEHDRFVVEGELDTGRKSEPQPEWRLADELEHVTGATQIAVEAFAFTVLDLDPAIAREGESQAVVAFRGDPLDP